MAYIGKAPANSALTSDDITDGIIGADKLATNSVTTVKVSDTNITSGKLADNAITLAKMASGTDGNLISYDASGNPVAVATGNDGQVLTSTGAGSPPVFETLATNTPAFFAKQGSNQSIANMTWTKMAINTEIFDSDSKYDTSAYRFTPTVAGKYFCFGQVNISGGSDNTLIQIAMYKNGSEAYMVVDRYPNGSDIAVNIQVVIDLDTDDYVEAYARHSQGVSANILAGSSFFGSYKIIGA